MTGAMVEMVVMGVKAMVWSSLLSPVAKFACLRGIGVNNRKTVRTLMSTLLRKVSWNVRRRGFGQFSVL